MIVTFYSYKGGVGRTQLLANVAVGLANRGFNIIMVDMDLESPGLHTYFHPSEGSPSNRRLSDQDFFDQPGLIDVLTAHWEDGNSPPNILPLLVTVDHPNLLDKNKGRMRLFPPGRLDAGYARRVSAFPWERFYAEAHGYALMEYIRQTLLEGDGDHPRADLVLIDSRTGLTDIGSICTGQLPEVLVVLFALHVQGIEGAKQIAKAVYLYRRNQGDQARLRNVVLLPSRVEEDGSIEKRDDMIRYAETNLVGLGDLISDLDDRLPYDPRIAYEETIVVGSQTLPTKLSQAYERFIERLIEMTALGAGGFSGARVADEKRAVAPVQLFEAINHMGKAVDDLVSACQAIKNRDFHPLLQAIIDADRFARVGYEKVLATARLLSVEDDPGSEFEALPKALPQHVADWQPLVAKLREIGDQIGNAWIQCWEQQARQRLGAVGAQSEVDERIKVLLEVTRKELPTDLEQRLNEAEQSLRRDSLDQRLRESKLSEEDLGRVIPNEATRLQWIETQLTRLQEEGDPTEPSFEKRLWNALKLLASLLFRDQLNRPDQAHWGAYDLLCMLTSPNNLRDLQCFEEIGSHLWLSEWRGFLAGDLPNDPEWPCGLEARTQLRRIAEQKPPSFGKLVGLVANAIGGEPHPPSVLFRLFEKRRDDPIVEKAILAMGTDPQIASRREILGIWLAINKPQRVGAVLAAFLRALAEDGYEAEAFFGACACFARFQDAREYNPTLWADLAVRFIALLVDKQCIPELNALLLEHDFVKLLAASHSGLGAMALLAGFSDRRVILDASVRHLLLTALLYGERRTSLPDTALAWLESVEKGQTCDTDAMTQVDNLEKKAREYLDITVYRSWDGAVYFEEAFKDYWEHMLELLYDDTGFPAQIFTICREKDAEDWIRKTFQDLKGQGKHATWPDKKAYRNLFNAYIEICKALEALVDARPGSMSIRHVKEQLAQKKAAYQDLLDWLVHEIQEHGLSSEKRIAQALGKQGEESQ